MRDDDCGIAEEKYGATFFHHYVRMMCGRSIRTLHRSEYGVLCVCAMMMIVSGENSLLCHKYEHTLFTSMCDMCDMRT